MHLDHPPPCPPSCGHCLAFDNITRDICSRTPSPRSKWCAVHEELQAKLLKTYKRYSLAVEAYDDSVLPTGIEQIVSEDDLGRLRRWSETCRQKWSLVRRVVVARAEHHQQFYAGGDWGHCLFVETLKDESVKLERFLRALDRQAYSVNLAQSSASWVLAVPRGPSFVCDDVPGPPRSAPDDGKHSSNGLFTPPPTPPLAEQQLPASSSDSPADPLQQASTMNKNQRKAARRKAARQALPHPTSPASDSSSTRLPSGEDAFFASLAPSSRPASTRELLSRLRQYLEFPSDLATSVRPETWHSVISGLFRHVILRIPALANLALGTYANAAFKEHYDDDDDGNETRVGTASCAGKLDSVESFLDLLELRLETNLGTSVPRGGAGARGGTNEIEQLWQGLKFARSSSSSSGGGADPDPDRDADESSGGLLGVGVLAEAVSNLFRPDANADADADEDFAAAGVELLGGKVWKEGFHGDWSREAWDLFYGFVACSGCVLIATPSIATWTKNRRLAALGHYPAWMSPSESLTGTADKVLRLSGIILCSSNAAQSGRKVKRIESKEKVPKGRGLKGKKVVFVEEWERNWMYIKLSVGDPRSRLVLDALASLPERFSVLARKTADDEVVHTPSEQQERCSIGRGCSCCGPSDLWLNKVRSGLSPHERKAARWSTTSYFPIETVLSSLLRSSSPEARFHSEPYGDSFDCLVLDSSPFDSPTHDNWTTFADSVAQAVLFAQGFETPSEMTRRERELAVGRGEMDAQEWERLCVAARPETGTHGGGGGGGGGKGGKQHARRVVYVCEEELTARLVFREPY